MKIKIKKKILVTMFVIILLLLGAFVGYYFLIKKPKEVSLQVNKYEELLEYCSTQRELNSLNIECEGFLASEYLSEDGLQCFAVLIPYEEGKGETYEICEEEKNIDWENPYPETSLYIPVVTIFKYERFLRGEYEFKSLGVKLMDDDKAFELLSLVNIPNKPDHITIMTQQYGAIKERNWYVTREGTEDGETTANVFAIRRGKIESYTFDGEDIVFDIRATLSGKEIALEASASYFTLEKSSTEYSGIYKGNTEELDVNSDYYMLLKIANRDFFDEGFIQSYLESPDEDTEFILQFISVR
jgi:hypothetical protein